MSEKDMYLKEYMFQITEGNRDCKMALKEFGYNIVQRDRIQKNGN